MALHCLIMTALEKTEYIALRDFAKLLRKLKKYFLPKERFHASFSSQLSRLSRFLKVLENWIRKYFITYNLKTWFILTRTKQNWPMKWKKKSLLFLPASTCRRDRVWFAFIWWHFPDGRVSGKTPRADHTWQNPPRLHTIPYNKIIRNCMELSWILTVQALCVFSWNGEYSN